MPVLLRLGPELTLAVFPDTLAPKPDLRGIQTHSPARRKRDAQCFEYVRHSLARVGVLPLADRAAPGLPARKDQEAVDFLVFVYQSRLVRQQV